MNKSSGYAKSAAGAGYGGQNGYNTRSSYGNSDPYANKNDPYSKKDSQGSEKEKKGVWALDFQILRFFRENYNAGIDFEESPRVFFDEEYMFNLRISLLKRNFTTILLKAIIMTLFSVVTLFLSTKLVLITGMFYIFLFTYLMAVPIGFVKYARQYIANDTEFGKLKKPHALYATYVKPLESIGINFLSYIFITIQALMFIAVEHVHNYVSNMPILLKFDKIKAFITTVSVSDMQTSIVMVALIYILSFTVYKIFIYRVWTPKWEAQREANDLAYRRANQRVARNLKDELERGSK